MNDRISGAQGENQIAPVSRLIAASAVPADGLRLAITADDQQRKAMARICDLVRVNNFRAHVDVARIARGLRVNGTIEADVVHTCVITLEDVTQTIHERFAERFLTARGVNDLRAERIAAMGADADQRTIDSIAFDLPEVLTARGCDVGALAFEYFVMALDPYPRKPGAVFDAGAYGGAGHESVGPTAVDNDE